MLLLLVVLFHHAQAAPGDVDLSFDPGSGVNGEVKTVAMQADGKLIVAGEFTVVKGLKRARIARLNRDGSGDASFDPGSGPDATVHSILLQADGKILVGGDFNWADRVERRGMVRLHSDGSVDQSFDSGPMFGRVRSVVAESNGRILIGGEFNNDYNSPNGRNRIARLNANGSLDATFLGTGANERVVAVAVDANGKVLIGGLFSLVNGVSRNRIARLNSDGSLDASFNPGAGANQEVYTIACLPGGKILMGGSFYTVNGAAVNAMARLNANGSQDPSFTAGTSLARFSTVRCITFQADERLLIGGTFQTFAGIGRRGIARLHPDGTLDSSFDPGNGVNNAVYAIALASDGQALIAGAFTSCDESVRNRVARLNGDGSLDPGFDPGLGIDGGGVYSLANQSDGYVLIGGSFAAVKGLARLGIARINRHGGGDATFAASGVSTPRIVRSAVVQPDGKVLIGGEFSSVNGTSRRNVARLHPDGTLDDSFDATLTENQVIHCVALQGEGKVLIGGYSIADDGRLSNIIARLHANGSLDANFYSPSIYDPSIVNSIVMQPDGKVLVGGQSLPSSGFNLRTVVRLNHNGSVDTGFNPEAMPHNVRCLFLQPDGKILVGGSYTTLTAEDYEIESYHLSRLRTDGASDASFFTAAGDPFSEPTGIRVEAVTARPDGKLLVGGSFTTFHGVNRNGIAGLNSDGTVDLNFDPGTGAEGPDRANLHATVFAIALQPDGMVLLGGDFTTMNGVLGPGLVRLLGDFGGSPNLAPSVSITSPADGLAFAAPQTVAISVNASDPDGTIGRVDIYAGGTLLGSDDSAPFEITWENAPGGSHTIESVATDDLGASTTSAPITISVTNTAPVVSITAPANGATFVAPATLAIQADASDADGTVARVDFYGGSTWIGSDNSAPFEATWSQVRAGNHSITAIATDNRGAATASTPVNVAVTNAAPTVSISSPASGSSFVHSTSVTIIVNASDSDGTVTGVTVYAGGMAIGTDDAAPFAIIWNNVPAGTHSLTARASDNGGAITTSATVTITVALPSPPAAPSGLTVRALSRTANELRWIDGSTNELGFKVERSSNGKTFAEIGRVSVNVTTSTDSGLSPGTKYTYRVRAYNSGGDSAYSNSATTK